MRYLFLILFLPLTLLGAKILSYNIYERTDRADVMITFDTPYHGTIKQSKGVSKTILKLEDASIESKKIKKVNSKYLKSIIITPMDGYTQIVAVTPSNVHLIASKTADAYGLRLRFTDKRKTMSASSGQQLAATQTTQSNLPTKKGNEFTTSYYIVVAILIIGIIILFILKKKIQKTQPHATQQNSWLFKGDTAPSTPNTTQQTHTPTQASDNGEISIRFQKKLDAQNSVVMLDFLDQSYLVLIGNGNILLDKFQDNKPASQSEFETILQERHNELEEFLQNPSTELNKPQHTKTSSIEDSLHTYKERAATLAYES